MSSKDTESTAHAVYALRLHLVFVTKYRRPTLTPAMREHLQTLFADILAGWRCALLEFGGEADHVHRLVAIHPALHIAALVNNLKSASSRRMRRRYADHLQAFYWKPYFWHRAYYVGSVGQASLETVQRYVQSPGTKPKRQ